MSLCTFVCYLLSTDGDQILNLNDKEVHMVAMYFGASLVKSLEHCQTEFVFDVLLNG